MIGRQIRMMCKSTKYFLRNISNLESISSGFFSSARVFCSFYSHLELTKFLETFISCFKNCFLIWSMRIHILSSGFTTSFVECIMTHAWHRNTRVLRLRNVRRHGYRRHSLHETSAANDPLNQQSTMQ